MTKRNIALAAAGFVLAAAAIACEPTGETREETRTIDAGGAKTAQVDLRMGAGTLRIEGGSASLMEASFRFNRRRLQPTIDYGVSGERGFLRIEQRRSTGISFGHTENDWNVRLGAVPMDIRMRLGAGESRLDLRRLDVSSVRIDMGVGDVKMDLSGPRTRNLDVSIHGGVGSADILLPADIGVRARVDGGIGSVTAHGLSKRGNVYTNDAFGRSPVTLELEVDAGIGSLDLRVERSASVSF